MADSCAVSAGGSASRSPASAGADLYSDLLAASQVPSNGLHDCDNRSLSGATVDSMLPDDGPAVSAPAAPHNNNQQQQRRRGVLSPVASVAHTVAASVQHALDAAGADACDGFMQAIKSAQRNCGPSPVSADEDEERRGLRTPGAQVPPAACQSGAGAASTAAAGVPPATGASLVSCSSAQSTASTRASLVSAGAHSDVSNKSDDDEPVPSTPGVLMGASRQTNKGATVFGDAAMPAARSPALLPRTDSILDDYFIDAQHLGAGCDATSGDAFSLRSAMAFDDEPLLPSLQSQPPSAAEESSCGDPWQNRVACDVLTEVHQHNVRPACRGDTRSGAPNSSSCRTPPAVLQPAARWPPPYGAPMGLGVAQVRLPPPQLRLHQRPAAFRHNAVFYQPPRGAAAQQMYWQAAVHHPMGYLSRLGTPISAATAAAMSAAAGAAGPPRPMGGHGGAPMHQGGPVIIGHHPHLPPQPYCPPNTFFEGRIYEMNKRLQHRLEESEQAALWWETFCNEFFDGDAVMTLRFTLDDGQRHQYALGRTLIPRYYRTMMEGVKDLYYLLRFPSRCCEVALGLYVLECDNFVRVTRHEKPSFTDVHTDGRLVCEFVEGPYGPRIRSWMFDIRGSQEFIPRSALAINSDPDYQASLSKDITRQGMTSGTLNYLKLCVILEPMQQLMSASKSQQGADPRRCLQQSVLDQQSRLMRAAHASAAAAAAGPYGGGAGPPGGACAPSTSAGPQCGMAAGDAQSVPPPPTPTGMAVAGGTPGPPSAGAAGAAGGTKKPPRKRQRKKDSAANADGTGGGGTKKRRSSSAASPAVGRMTPMAGGPGDASTPAGMMHMQMAGGQPPPMANQPFPLASHVDVMVVGEPSLMGSGLYGEEDERRIARLENTQYDPSAAGPFPPPMGQHPQPGPMHAHQHAHRPPMHPHGMPPGMMGVGPGGHMMAARMPPPPHAQHMPPGSPNVRPPPGYEGGGFSAGGMWPGGPPPQQHTPYGQQPATPQQQQHMQHAQQQQARQSPHTPHTPGSSSRMGTPVASGGGGGGGPPVSGAGGSAAPSPLTELHPLNARSRNTPDDSGAH